MPTTTKFYTNGRNSRSSAALPLVDKNSKSRVSSLRTKSNTTYTDNGKNVKIAAQLSKGHGDFRINQ